MYKITVTKRGKKDAVKIQRSNFKSKVDEIIRTIEDDPYNPTQGFEKMTAELRGAYSREINRQHRFVYTIEPNTENLCDDTGTPYEGFVKIISMWTHYEM